MPQHSQNNEESLLLAHFGDKADGRFLDVGAWCATTFSNVRALALRGWSGVCVEPSPNPFAGLMEAYRSRPDIQLVNAAVAADAGLVPFADAGGDALSTLSIEHRAKWPGVPWQTIYVSAVTVTQLLNQFSREFDLLAIDTEGSSAVLARQFPIEEMPRLGAIVVEHDGRGDELAKWARAFGFREVGRNAENLVVVR